MQGYLVSLGFGIVIGCLYGLSGVRSPAPPLIALAGLLGILAGEQATRALGLRFLSSTPRDVSTTTAGDDREAP